MSEIGVGHQGWFEEPYDDRDKMYTPSSNTVVKESINLWMEYPKAVVPPYNQLTTNTCVANATAAALWYQLNFSSTTMSGAGGPSRLFIYWNARVSELSSDNKTAPADDGAYNRRAMRSLDKIGDCDETSWPFAADRTQLEPDANAYTAAKNCQIDVYWRLDPSRPTDNPSQQVMADDSKTTLANLRACLSEGYPVVLGFRYYWNQPPWTKHEDGTWQLPDMWKDGTTTMNAGPTANNFGGHAVLAIGYDDKKGVVIIQNSWGANASLTGAPIFYMPYNWIIDYRATSDFWTLRHSNQKKS